VNDVLAVLETYYDTAPRAAATAEEHGPFTVFVRTRADGWPYYARPRLGLGDPVSRADVDAVRARQREVGAPEALEWVHETTPSLLEAARSSGLRVDKNPLLVLAEPVAAPATDAEVRVLAADESVEAVVSAVHAGFSDSDEVEPRPGTRQVELMRRGLLALVGAYDDRGLVLGGGSHSPRGDATELTGIAVLPGARRRGVGAAVTAALVADARARGCGTVFLSAQDDAVARVYERVGFVRVGTACVAGTGR
jgi:ribosomal protein S18 acetylase RimI-like enzyme